MAQRKGARASRAARRGHWWQLRQRWRMLGVFEINPEHEFYQLTAMIKEGMQTSIQTTMDTPVHGFEMQTFAASVFAKLRSSLEITDEEYMNSLCSGGCYLQFVSNSKSKADFFVTNDKRFFLKTQSRREVKFLLSNLQAYMDHLEKHPHSLMVRFLGKNNFSLVKCETILNGNVYVVAVDQEKTWFTNQVKADSAFLRELNVLDYSLLLAQQPLHQDELEGKHSLANLVIRATKSLDFYDSPTESDPPTIPLLEKTTGEVVPDMTECGSGKPQAAAEGSGEGIPLQEMNSSVRETRTDSELQEFHKHHRRLLPNCKNAIHVIDGPNHRYFVGIIDIFTVYGWKKRLENLWKDSASQAGPFPQSTLTIIHQGSVSGYRTTLSDNAENITHMHE
ncbi:Phosphatidylinositol 4-phosphate 5-kinase-like protein 1 [Nibea albiflora]|uniref:Phosphatidylinositol 4-phosphate 5-kinase-like protein 1 n=1 Tax=Nibea albiflora TaxID=240163 RepID=A0ACB7FBI0_NIBAL|nr:Phosphatidylinositol 4-phosphate 5-kinase-like protein 1 [Nibea albiflora]